MDIVIVLDGSNSIYPWYEVRDFLINVLQKFYVGPGQIQVRLSYDLENQFHTVLTLIYAPFGLYNTPMYSWGSGTRQTEQTNLIIQENMQNYELNTN